MNRKFTERVAKTIGRRTLKPEVRTVTRKYSQNCCGSCEAKRMICMANATQPAVIVRAIYTLARVGILQANYNILHGLVDAVFVNSGGIPGTVPG